MCIYRLFYSVGSVCVSECPFMCLYTKSHQQSTSQCPPAWQHATSHTHTLPQRLNLFPNFSPSPSLFSPSLTLSLSVSLSWLAFEAVPDSRSKLCHPSPSQSQHAPSCCVAILEHLSSSTSQQISPNCHKRLQLAHAI